MMIGTCPLWYTSVTEILFQVMYSLVLNYDSAKAMKYQLIENLYSTVNKKKDCKIMKMDLQDICHFSISNLYYCNKNVDIKFSAHDTFLE